MSSTETPNPIPATFLRGGTSKGIFLNRAVLPADRKKWDPIFLGIMGSPDPHHGRQLNGMGGGVSSLSKIIVVGPSSLEGVDMEYTFAQVGIKDRSVDYSGNCGNLSSVVGVFAVDERICALPQQQEQRSNDTQHTHVTIRSFNTNTRKIIDTTFPVSNSSTTPVLDLPETSIAGVPGVASTITLEFIDPAGARTGHLLPTGSPVDALSIPSLSQPQNATPSTVQIRATCLDATNPTVFVSYSSLATALPPGLRPHLPSYLAGRSMPEIGVFVESIRQAAALRMGLDPRAQAQPKIGVLSPPTPLDPPTNSQREGREEGNDGHADTNVDVNIHALSMRVIHKVVPMTVGLALGVAARVEGTIAWDIVQAARNSRGRMEGMVRIRHPGGVVDVDAEFEVEGDRRAGVPKVRSAKVMRTGRRLMKGVVWW